MSEEYFSRLFKSELKEGFIEYLTKIRLQKATDFVKNSDVMIYEISSLVGYNDPKYFSKLFKKKYGMTPSQMRDGS